jgi:hypothetical protein
MPGALVNCQRKKPAIARDPKGPSPSARNPEEGRTAGSRSGYPPNKGSGPVSRGWPPSACGKLTARQPRERRGVPRLK